MKQHTSSLRDNSTAADPGPDRRFALIALTGLMALILAICFGRVIALPVLGQESRRARVIVLMLNTGVPRQRGGVFPKPPFSSRPIAFCGMPWGEVVPRAMLKTGVAA